MKTQELPYRPLSAPDFVLCAINMCDAQREEDQTAYQLASEQLHSYLAAFANHAWIIRSIGCIFGCYGQQIPDMLRSKISGV
jgi:hypothetical protein